MYMVDMDGTLCEEICFTVEKCLTATPKKAVIEKVNKLYEENFITIYTARRDQLIEATLTWLRANGVRFHTISNQKIPADYYIDDRAMRPDEL